jgi:hypothetical protein
MSQTILSMSNWVSLPNEVRYKIRALFNIPRSGNTLVNDGRIETDGTTYQDFEALTTEKMQKYLGDDSTDFHKLFDLVVAKVNDELTGKKSEDVVVSSDSPVSISIDEPIKKKRGRPSKK